MSKSNTATPGTATEGKKSKKGLIVTILVAFLAIGAGVGGTWYFMKMSGSEEEAEPAKPKVRPTTFVDLDIFTVNLQPEENNQYLQVGLTVKVTETDVVQEIAKQMPAIRNRILMLLSSKKAAEIADIAGKQQLSQQIADEIKQTLSGEEQQEDIREVLFTSFVIQ